MSFRDWFKSDRSRYFDWFKAEHARLVADNNEMRSMLYAKIAGNPSAAVAPITGNYQKCSNCKLLVARFEKKTDGSIVCANCDDTPRAKTPAETAATPG